MAALDIYRLSENEFLEPPATLWHRLKFLGPGFILSASIVGSGELIATTALGAKAGFAALWIIILSCLIKVAVQVEFGRHAITTGETPMQGLGHLPGPRLKKAGWAVWLFFVLLVLKIVQIGGILGGTSIVLSMLMPGIPIAAWAMFMAIVVGALIFNGRYNWIEKLSLGMIALFTLITLASLSALQFTSYDFSLADIFHGLRWKLSGEVIGYAIGAFGITGVAADEIVAYNYWCLEKGYAKYTGKHADTPQWTHRARGWIRVMLLDAVVAMLIYTTVTVTFYLLGAAVLHTRDEVPMGDQVIEVLALIYTRSLGPGVKTVYLVGAFFVLFSSLYATLAAWTRAFPDIFGQIGWMNFFDVMQRRQVIALLAWTIPLLWAAAFLFIKLPVLMVLSGGVVGSGMLLIVALAAGRFKQERPQRIPTRWHYDALFWVSVTVIFGLGIYGVYSLFG